MTFKAFGDSITTNSTSSGASPAANSWIGRFTPVTAAVSGAGAGDMAKTIQTSHSAEPSRKYAVMIGTNDARHYKGDTTKQGYFKNFLRCGIVWLTCPNLKKARTSGTAVYTGSWANTQGNAFGKTTTANGAKVEETFSGDVLYLGYLAQNSSSTDSVVEVRVDGNLIDTISSYMNSNTVGGNSFSGMCNRYAGLGAGAHTVELTVTSAGGKRFYYDFVAGSDDIDSAGVALSNVPEYSPAGYTSFGITSAIIDQYNAIVDDLIADFTADGLNIALVDNHASIVNTTDLADSVHPNNAGHAKINANFSAVLAAL
jgi:hypothetical protein